MTPRVRFALAIAELALAGGAYAYFVLLSFAFGFAFVLIVFLVPTRLHCEAPACILATSPVQDTLFAVVFLALPVGLFVATVALRATTPRQRAAPASSEGAALWRREARRDFLGTRAR